MRLLVLINAFNEARMIAKAIESVYEVSDEIHLFDGAYKDYPHEQPYSTDKTIAIAEAYPKVKVHRCTKPYENQMAKRTAMFCGQEGDYYFKLDGDEYVANPEIIRQYLKDIDVGWCWTLSNLYPKPVMTARIFKHQQGLHYAGRHHWLYDGRNNFVTSDQNMNPRFIHRDTPIRVYNFRESSTPERIKDKQQFLVNRSYELQYKREDQAYGKFSRIIPHPRRAPAPKLSFEVAKYTGVPKYSMTLMVSRSWIVSDFFRHLKTVQIPEDTELLVVIDTNNHAMIRTVLRLLNEQQKRFVNVKYAVTNNPRLPEFSSVQFRRQRIIDNWHLLLTELRGDIVLGAEDDSFPDKDAYIKLLKTMEKEKADFVQGSIISRWHVNIIPCWKIEENYQGNPVKVWTEKEKRSGIEPIQGIGWYCFVSYADVMRKYPMQVDNLLPLGPDVRFGYQLYKNGFKLLHQWDVRVVHVTEKKRLILGKDPTITKTWTKENGKWISVKSDFSQVVHKRVLEAR